MTVILLEAMVRVKVVDILDKIITNVHKVHNRIQYYVVEYISF